MPSDTFRPLPTSTAAGVDDTMLRVLHSEPLLSRTNYFDGRLLTAADLDRDYAYLDRRMLDLGLAAGDGIVAGLHATLAGTVLSVTGGRAIAASGRVLTLNRPAGQPLQVDLADMGTVMARNTAFAGFRDALYAVVLMLTETGTGAADVFPRDLASRRTTSFDTITDFVEIALVPLRQQLPAGNAFQARAALGRSLAGSGIAGLRRSVRRSHRDTRCVVPCHGLPVAAATRRPCAQAGHRSGQWGAELLSRTDRGGDRASARR